MANVDIFEMKLFRQFWSWYFAQIENDRILPTYEDLNQEYWYTL